MINYYKLIGKLVVPCKDAREWAAWFEKADRRVFKTGIGPLRVSTVFIGLDHGYYAEDNPLLQERPLLFETMIFNDDWADLYCDRCSTWEEAEAMHDKACKEAEKMLEAANLTLKENRDETDGTSPCC